MQRARRLLQLSGRLQAAASAGGCRAACQPASQQRTLPPVCLRSWTSSASSTGASAAAQPSAVQQAAAAPMALRAAQGRGHAAAAAGRRGFAADAVSRPGPAPRGTSKAGSGRSLWSGLFLLAPGGLAAFLAKWQWDRREWKREMLERREAAMTGEPVDLFAAEEEPAEYRRVVVAGTFDHGAAQYVGPRTRTFAGTSKQGYLLITPLRQAGGGGRCVMVHRGWVPTEWRESAELRATGEPAGVVRVEGVLRRGEDPGSFVPPNEPAKGAWYYVNTSELAAAAGLPPQAPLVEVVTESPGSYIGRGPPTPMDVLGGRGRMPVVEEAYPLPKSLDDLLHFSVMPQDHLNYAATWATLSAASLALAVKAIRQGVRPR